MYIHTGNVFVCAVHCVTGRSPRFSPPPLHHPKNTNSATCNGTLHFSHWIRPGGSWHPEYLTPLHLPLILERLKGKQAFWARKVDVGKGGAALMDALDYRRRCAHALEGEVGTVGELGLLVACGGMVRRDGWMDGGSSFLLPFSYPNAPTTDRADR